MSTSTLQEYTAKKLYDTFPHLAIKENYRPQWLHGNGSGVLELDFYLPEIKVAVEVQGDQHYIYVPYFHGDYDGFLSQQNRDEIKRSVCFLESIKLYEVSNQSEVDNMILDVQPATSSRILHKAIVEKVNKRRLAFENLSPEQKYMHRLIKLSRTRDYIKSIRSKPNLKSKAKSELEAAEKSFIQQVQEIEELKNQLSKCFLNQTANQLKFIIDTVSSS